MAKVPNLQCLLLVVFALSPCGFAQDPDQPRGQYEYRLLATLRTSSMEKEMNQEAEHGFRFQAVMGGDTAFGGKEMVVVMSRRANANSNVRFDYVLLATNKTSTMAKEMREAGKEGFQYKGQTVYKSAFGGKEVVVIMERDLTVNVPGYEYRLLATSKTSTMEKELIRAGKKGFSFTGVTVGKTAFGGEEVVSILERPLARAQAQLTPEP